MQSKDILIELCKPLFKKYGFTKKGTSWYLINEEIIGVFNIQKSQWSDLCYLNIALFIRKNEEMSFMPNYAICHFHQRVGQSYFSNDDKEKMQNILSFEQSPSNNDLDFLKQSIELVIQKYFLKNTCKSDLIITMNNEKENPSWNLIAYDGKERLK